jgi:hypothetical protein
MDTRSFVLPLPKQSKNILPTRLNQDHSKPIIKQKEKRKAPAKQELFLGRNRIISI